VRSTAVDKLHEEFTALIALLDAQNEPSLRASVDDNFRRSLLLAAASYFESRMVACVLLFAEEVTGANIMLTEFVRIKGIERQYHSWFEWKDNNAIKFFSLFGSDFKSFMKAKVAKDARIESAISSFMEIGRDRNRLVHENFASFTLEKTANDIYAAYQNGLHFVEAMPKLLREFPRSNPNASQAQAL